MTRLVLAVEPRATPKSAVPTSTFTSPVHCICANCIAPCLSPCAFAILRCMSIRKAAGTWEPMLLGIDPRICPVCKEGLYRNKTLFSGGWSRCALCEEFVHYSCLASGKVSFLKARPACARPAVLLRRALLHLRLKQRFRWLSGRDPHSQSSPVEARPGWRYAFFPDLVRFVLAPLILLFSGYFTANFILSGALHLATDQSGVGADSHRVNPLP